VVDSDLIVVLDAGAVVAQGTHGSLLTHSPLYRELAEHQLLA
jgi:ATP-binding cassette subfamily B protein